MRQMSFSFMHKKRGRDKYEDDLVDQWESLYRDGASYREIATLFSVPFPTVFWHLHTKRGLGDGRSTGRKKKYKGLSDAEVTRQWQLKENYGLSLAERDAMEIAQDGKCAICGNPERGGKRLHVDHDHVTGKVRGLLCSEHNTGLGKFSDNPELLEKAASYLREAA